MFFIGTLLINWATIITLFICIKMMIDGNDDTGFEDVIMGLLGIIAIFTYIFAMALTLRMKDVATFIPSIIGLMLGYVWVKILWKEKEKRCKE